MSYTKIIFLLIVLCTFLSDLTSQKISQQEAEFQILKTLSFNAWALPVWLPGSAQKKRYKQIASHLLEKDVDILCVQEAFSKKFRKKVLPELATKYEHYTDYSCNKNILGPFRKDCYGGLMTFSKHPIIQEQFYQFPINKSMRIEERIGAKGFLVSTIKKHDLEMLVINTHLYAGPNEKDEDQRLHQINYMKKILVSEYDLEAQPVLLLGDLNVRHPSVACASSDPPSRVYDFILDEMGFTDPGYALQDDWYTIDPMRNKYTNENNKKQKLDYCMVRPSCYISFTCQYQDACFAGNNTISDHLGWLSTYQVNDDLPTLPSTKETTTIVTSTYNEAANNVTTPYKMN